MPYRMKSGKWRAERMFDNTRRTKTFATKQDAKKWEAEQKPEPPKSKTITAYSVAAEYLDHCQREMSTRTYYEKRYAFKCLFQVAKPDTAFDAITPKQVFDVLAKRAQTSGNAANITRKELVAWAAWVKRIHGLDNPAFSNQQKWRFDKQPRYVPSEDDFWRVHAVCEPEDQTLLLAYLHTAARRDELLRLQWTDVDFQGGTIRLGTRKRAGGMEYDLIPMTSQLSAALQRHKQTALRSVYVFTRPTGERYIKRDRYMNRMCARAGVKQFGWHAIRHLSASMLGHAGVPLPTIQAILRHKDATTTSRYLHSLGVVENVMESVFGSNLHKSTTQAKIVNLKS